MQTTTNNTEPSAVKIQSTDNLTAQQKSHVKTFQILGCLQIVFGGIALFLSLVQLSGTAYIFEATLSLCACCGWFVFTGCIPQCMSGNTMLSSQCKFYFTGCTPQCMSRNTKSLKCKKTGFMVCSFIGAFISSPITFFISIGMEILHGRDKSSNLTIFSFGITLLSCVLGLVALISASYCCCCSRLKTPNQQTDVVMSNSQPENAPENLTQAPNMLPLIDSSGYTVLHPRAQLYYIVGGADQGVGNTQNPNIA
ncbi:uncharacterized protein LOC143055651 [Mytilus galloprovincialis]|uniref:uncharacterized protein LOC143055651 n=1 Tax=Mytilus galloprovincialis TaxID=29158 RepID=UPI003F7BE040